MILIISVGCTIDFHFRVIIMLETEIQKPKWQMFRFDTLHWVCLNVTHNFMLLAASFTLSILVECSLIDIFVHHAIDGPGNKMRDSRTPPQPFWDVNKKAFNIRFAGLRQAIFLNTLDHIRTHIFFQYPVWCRWLWWKNRQISRTPNYLFRHSQKYALRVKKSDEMETMKREKNTAHCIRP